VSPHHEGEIGSGMLSWSDRPPNEGLEQTRSAMVTAAAALAAQARCSTDLSGSRADDPCRQPIGD